MDYALSYINQGYAVFPLQPNGKAPLTPNGFKDATKDPEQVRQWWTKWPEANVGIATGRTSGVVVLDVDRKHGVDGAVSAAELNLPQTLTIRTPTGGFHLFFKAPPDTIIPRKIGVKPGLDILGESGYVVGAGSAVNGSMYTIVRNLPIVECPQAIIDLAGKQNTNIGAPNAEPEGKIREGGRNSYLASIGGKLRRIGFSSEEMIGALLAINTLRLDPPLSEAEVRRTAASVARYLPDSEAAEKADEVTSISCQPLDELLRATYPPIEHLSDPILVHPGLCLLYGPSGISKTYFTLSWALAVASGQNFLKWSSGRPRSVLYIDGELGSRVMQQRIKLLQAGHEYVVKAGFYVSSFDSQPNGIFPDLENPVSQLRYLNGIPEDVQLVVIDSLSTLCAMEDANDYKSWGGIQKFLLALRRRGVSVIVVHHANKGGNEQAGTSRRIHVMDTVISLRAHVAPDGNSAGYKDVEVHVTKGRNLPPNMSEPFIATLSSPLHLGESMVWTSGELGMRKVEQIEELLRTGMPVSAVVQEVGCAPSLAYKVRARLEESGSIVRQRAKRGPKGGGSYVE